MKKIESTICLRRDTESNYETIKNTFIPSKGEVILVDTTNKGLRFKIGDGLSTYAELSYVDKDIAAILGSLGVTISATTAGQPNYTPEGTVSVITNTANVATVTNAGTAYQLSDGSIFEGADITSAFATEGLVASIGVDEESETLILTPAATSNAVTASKAIIYTPPVLTGSLPTFGTQEVVTGIEDSTFTGTGVNIFATPTYEL